MTIWRMRIACWIPKPTNTLSEYIILIPFLLRQWLHERASMLHFTYIACLVNYKDVITLTRSSKLGGFDVPLATALCKNLPAESTQR